MANRYTTQFINNLQKGVNKVNATVTFAGASAPSVVRGSNFNSQGLVSVTRNNTGLYTFVFGTQVGMLDVYNSLLSVSVVFNTVATSAVPAAPLYYISALAVATPGTCSLQLTFTDKAQVGATDPASGEIGYFEFTLKNSTAP